MGLTLDLSVNFIPSTFSIKITPGLFPIENEPNSVNPKNSAPFLQDQLSKSSVEIFGKFF